MTLIPDAQDLWEGIGGHFDSFDQILCEFIDNSIANFDANNVTTRNIVISLSKSKDKIKTVVEDQGTGIKNFIKALKIGDKSGRESPLNEHGFGLKHGLASANITNDNWIIYTRTKIDFANNQYKIFSSPYEYEKEPEIIQLDNSPWPGTFNDSGTIVEFQCDVLLFNTLQKGIPGQAGFEKCIIYLKEELGYIYAGVIEDGRVNITIRNLDNNEQEIVKAVKPNYVGFYEPYSEITRNIGNGNIIIGYVFGEMKDSNSRHYKRNMATSGVEIRINGRLIMDNLFSEIWTMEKHPKFNHFLVQINLISDKRERLPKTRTSKNGIRSGDKKLDYIYKFIYKKCQNPPDKITRAMSEKEIVKELAKKKKIHMRNATIKTEFEVFTKVKSPVLVDLFIDDNNEIILYEAKKSTADVQGLYQLLMYWDGALFDGLKPTEGILLADDFSPGVKPILEYLNNVKDQTGVNYNFKLKTWKDEDVTFE